MRSGSCATSGNELGEEFGPGDLDRVKSTASSARTLASLGTSEAGTVRNSIFDDDEDTGEEYPWTKEDVFIIVYGAFNAMVSRLPHVLGFIQMIKVHEMSFTACSVLLCIHSICEILPQKMCWGRYRLTFMLFSAGVRVFNYMAIFAFEQDWLVFSAMYASLGAGEGFSGPDSLLKMHCERRKLPKKRQQARFRVQVIAVATGSTVAYWLGGILYEDFGCGGACIFGAVGASLQFIVMAVYAFLDWEFVKSGFKVEERPSHSMERGETTNSGIDEAGNRIKALGSYRRALKQGRRLSDDSDASPKPAWSPPTVDEDMRKTTLLMTRSMACSSCFLMVAIMTNYAVLSFYMLDSWNCGTSTTGAFMGIGEALSVAVLLFFQWPLVFDSWLTFPFGKPMNVCLTTVVIGLCSFLVVMPSLPVAAMGIIGIHTFTTVAGSFNKELCVVIVGWKEFGVYGDQFDIVGRIAKCSVWVIMTVLLGMGRLIPHIVSGLAMCSWGVALACYYASEGLAPTQVSSRLELLLELLERLPESALEGPHATIDDGNLLAAQDPAVVSQLVRVSTASSKLRTSTKLKKGLTRQGTALSIDSLAIRTSVHFDEEARSKMRRAIEAEVLLGGIAGPMQRLSMSRLKECENQEKRGRLSGRISATGRPSALGGDASQQARSWRLTAAKPPEEQPKGTQSDNMLMYSGKSALPRTNTTYIW